MTDAAQPNNEHREFWLRWCRDFFILESGIAGPHVPWLNELLKSHPADAPEDPNWYLTVRDWIDGLFDSDCEQIRRNPSVRAALHRKNIELRESGYNPDVPEGPYVCGEIVEGRMCSVWHKDECSRDSVFMGSGEQAPAVRDLLNRLHAKGGTK